MTAVVAFALSTLALLSHGGMAANQAKAPLIRKVRQESDTIDTTVEQAMHIGSKGELMRKEHKHKSQSLLATDMSADPVGSLGNMGFCRDMFINGDKGKARCRMDGDSALIELPSQKRRGKSVDSMDECIQCAKQHHAEKFGKRLMRILKDQTQFPRHPKGCYQGKCSDGGICYFYNPGQYNQPSKGIPSDEAPVCVIPKFLLTDKGTKKCPTGYEIVGDLAARGTTAEVEAAVEECRQVASCMDKDADHKRFRHGQLTGDKKSTFPQGCAVTKRKAYVKFTPSMEKNEQMFCAFVDKEIETETDTAEQNKKEQQENNEQEDTAKQKKKEEKDKAKKK